MATFEHPKFRDDLKDIVEALRRHHQCHTAILYGSFAVGDATPESDYDVAGFADSPNVERIAGKWRNSYLDIFVYPESKLDSPSSELLHLRNGSVLFEKGDAGKRLLADLDEIYRLGPERLPLSELRARHRWAWKMLDRAAKEDPEGNFRRTWLLTALLEDHFRVRHMWYMGPKKSLAYLKLNSPDVYSAFEAALIPGASFEIISKVVEAVVGPREEGTVNDELMGSRETSDVSALRFREMKVADVPGLFYVRPRTRENAMTLEELQRLGINPQSVTESLGMSTKGWVCVDSDRVVAFSIADRATGEFLAIAVLPEYERKGVGGRLMALAGEWLTASGCKRAWLTTDLDTTLRAYGFYRKLGWTDWKIERGLRWMELSLPRCPCDGPIIQE